VKPETKLWQKVKKNTSKIKWTRLESWALLGYRIYLVIMIAVVFLWLSLRLLELQK